MLERQIPKANHIHETAPRIVYKRHVLSFEVLLKLDKSFKIHHRNFISSTCLIFTLKLMHSSGLFDLTKAGKNLVPQLWLKMLATNEIAGFFDHQYFWKKSINILDFVHEDNHQRKTAFQMPGCMARLACQIVGIFEQKHL